MRQRNNPLLCSFVLVTMWLVQFPFTLEQQRIIAAMLNTMVYYGLMTPSKGQDATLMDAAVRCLRSLYERDCRRSFCDAALWLAPATSLDLHTAAAARAHREVSTASAKMGDTFQGSGLGAVLTTIPHVLPFEKRLYLNLLSNSLQQYHEYSVSGHHVRGAPH